MNWKKFVHSLADGICTYITIWLVLIILCAFGGKYAPPQLDGVDALIGILILAYSTKKGLE